MVHRVVSTFHLYPGRFLIIPSVHIRISSAKRIRSSWTEDLASSDSVIHSYNQGGHR